MRRRDFIRLLGSAAATWPLAARAQQPAMPVVGFLSSQSPQPFESRLRAFRDGLRDVGFVEGKDVAIEYRWADDQTERLPALVSDLVRHQVAVIAVINLVPALAAKAATTTSPIVFAVGADPVQSGLVTSLSRPSANLTGVYSLADELAPKRVGLLHELLPAASAICLLVNPAGPVAETQLKSLQAAAGTLGLQTRVLRHLIPALYFRREFVAAGGLMSYSSSTEETYRWLGDYTARILKGSETGDLPVQRATKYELVFNLKTAKALGLTIPPNLIAIADEVIE